VQAGPVCLQELTRAPRPREEAPEEVTMSNISYQSTELNDRGEREAAAQ